MPHTHDDPAREILAAYEAMRAEFREVTRRARGRFLGRAWADAQRDAAERLEVYPRGVARAVDALRGRVRPDGGALKERFAERLQGRPDPELAQTFFSSVVRRLLETVGVDPDAEFTPAGDAPPEGDGPIHRAHETDGLGDETFRALFRATELADQFAALDTDAEACAARARTQLGSEAEEARAVDALPFLFYRNKGAYLVARLRLASGEVRPLVVALASVEDGVRPDAVLTDVDEISVVFSFARSYFHADTERVGETVAFLRTLMPAKPVNELYTSLGHNKHGKTELYRELVRQMASPGTRFEAAEGTRGMVMSVFTLPAYNVVFKVIKDRFAAPKQVTREEVRQKYRLVFAHDRVGRLVDAQEFEDLTLPRSCFSDELLGELLRDAAGSVSVGLKYVVVRHLYTERRLRPLDVYLREASQAEAVAAVIEYGNAIRDLAAANIFPGDLLLKNFGVSRHGRVIFYDYDELSLLSEVRFRSIPKARYEEDEMGADAWFSVDDRDVFPEEFVPFLVPPGRLREAFMEAHGELFTVRFWKEMQRRQEGGDIADIFPYPRERRLRWDEASPPHPHQP